MRITWVLATMLVGAAALADPPPDNAEPNPFEQSMTIVVGQSKLLQLGAAAGAGTCDDTSVVRVEDAGSALRIVALKVGKTDCGFWTQLNPGRHTLVHITVVDEEQQKNDGTPPKPPTARP